MLLDSMRLYLEYPLRRKLHPLSPFYTILSFYPNSLYNFVFSPMTFKNAW
jgi:hypothetical protein